MEHSSGVACASRAGAEGRVSEMTQVTRTVCETCRKEARDEAQQRHEEWIRLDGELHVWLEKPRKKGHGLMHSIGYHGRREDFCCIACLVKALNAKVSIP